ncbi:hypothetical protein [Streptomyces sp. NPDC059092]|uniref:hypothetical protein n=1 Tax=Streptomyces sp. NPDC059092 TaxID=3346725 RepID=UPI0036CA1482
MAPIARQEELVDQIVFRWDTENSLGTTGFGPVAWSCDRDTAESLFNSAAPLLRTTASDTVPALVKLESRGRVLLVRRAPVLDLDGRSGAVCHALFGPAKTLDPETCLGLHDWEWEGGGLPLGRVRGALEQVRVAGLLASAEQGQRALLAGLPELAEPLTTMAAELLRHPGQGFTVLDRHGGDGPCRMLWGLYGVFSGLFPEGWTFATHDTVETPATRFVFVRRWPGPAPQSTERVRTDPEERTDDRAQALAAGLVGHYLRRIGRGEGSEYEVAGALAGISGPWPPGAGGTLLDTAEEALERLTEWQPRRRERDPRERDLRERDPRERDPRERDAYQERPPSPQRVPYDRDRPEEPGTPYGPGDVYERDRRDPSYGHDDRYDNSYDDRYGDSYGDRPDDRYAAPGHDDRYAARPAHQPLSPSRTSSPPTPSYTKAPPVQQVSEPRRQGRRMFRPVPPEWPVSPESARFLGTRRKVTVELDHLLAVLHTFQEPNASSRNVKDALRGSSGRSLVAAVGEDGLHYAAVTALVGEIATRYAEWPRGRRQELCEAVLKRELFVGDRPWPASVGLPSRETRAANAAALYGWTVRPLAGAEPVKARLLELLPRLSRDAIGAGRAAVEQILEGEKAPGLGKEVWLAIVRAGWRDSGATPAAPLPPTRLGTSTTPGRPALSGPRAPSYGHVVEAEEAAETAPDPVLSAPSYAPPPPPPPSSPPPPSLPPLPPRQETYPGATAGPGAPRPPYEPPRPGRPPGRPSGSPLRRLAGYFGADHTAGTEGERGSGREERREPERRPPDGRNIFAGMVVLFVAVVVILLIALFH